MADTNKTAGSTGAACRQCGLPLPPQKRGRPRIYCSASCRQQAYEKRHDIEPWKQRCFCSLVTVRSGGLEANADASAMNHVKRQMAAASRRARRDPNATFSSVENVQGIWPVQPRSLHRGGHRQPALRRGGGRPSRRHHLAQPPPVCRGVEGVRSRASAGCVCSSSCSTVPFSLDRQVRQIPHLCTSRRCPHIRRTRVSGPLPSAKNRTQNSHDRTHQHARRPALDDPGSLVLPLRSCRDPALLAPPR